MMNSPIAWIILAVVVALALHAVLRDHRKDVDPLKPIAEYKNAGGTVTIYDQDRINSVAGYRLDDSSPWMAVDPVTGQHTILPWTPVWFQP